MTAHQLKTSGRLEAYLLGLIPDQEQTVMADLIAADAELTAYVRELNSDLTRHFLVHAVPPPPAIRGVIELKDAEQGLQKRSRPRYDFRHETGSQQTTPNPDYIDVDVDNTHIRVHKYWRPAFVAVFVLSKVFLVASVYYYFKADSQAQEISRLKAEMHQTTPK